MKRIYIGIGALALALGAVASGLVGAGKAEPTKAVTPGSGHTWGLIGDFTGWSYDAVTSTFNEEDDVDEITYTLAEGSVFKIRADEAWTVAIGSAELTQSRTGGDTYFEDDASGNAKVKIGYTGSYTFKLKNGVYSYGDKSYGVTVSFVSTTHFDVSEYAVLDGVKEAAAFKTEQAIVETSFTPTTPIRSGYSFGGWYTNEACTTSYVATTWTEAGSLYAKFTSYTTEKFVYFAAPTWTECYVYTFGGQSGLGAWPGTKCLYATDGVTYGGTGIYKVPYFGDASDTTIIFNDGSTTGTKGTTQSYDLVLAEDTYYKLSDLTTGDLGHGLAASVIFDINYARRAVAANTSTGILAASVCGITSAKAKNLVAEYDALSSDDYRGYVDAATDFVYQYDNTANGVNVAFSSIVAELRLLGKTVYSVGTIDQTFRDSSAVIIALSIIVSGFAAGGLMLGLSKKRKRNDR